MEIGKQRGSATETEEVACIDKPVASLGDLFVWTTCPPVRLSVCRVEIEMYQGIHLRGDKVRPVQFGMVNMVADQTGSYRSSRSWHSPETEHCCQHNTLAMQRILPSEIDLLRLVAIEAD